MEQCQFDSSPGFEQPQKPKSHVSVFGKAVRYFFVICHKFKS